LGDAVGAETAVGPTLPSGNRQGGAFLATWRRPWMTLNADTYGSSMLHAVGWDNVFGGADARYPEVTLDEVAGCGPDLIVLPDEPYAFTQKHVPEVRNAVPEARIVLVDGRDLFWWGIRTPAALERLRRALA
jgi:hypothetical protein